MPFFEGEKKIVQLSIYAKYNLEEYAPKKQYNSGHPKKISMTDGQKWNGNLLFQY